MLILVLISPFLFVASKYGRQVAYYTGPTGVYEPTSTLYQFLLEFCNNVIVQLFELIDYWLSCY